MVRVLFILLFLLPVSFPGSAQDDLLAEIRNLAPGEVKMDGFVLPVEQEIAIEGIGGESRRFSAFADAWILNSRSREVVWTMGRTRQRGREWPTEFNDLATLPGGEYEVYYAVYPFGARDFESFGDFLSFLVDEIFDRKDYRRRIRDLRLSIRGKGTRLGTAGVDSLHALLRDEALVSLTGLWDNEYVKQGFVLDRPMKLSLYAIGEIRGDNLYDHGWIVNARTGERVWRMLETTSRPAGGDRKNRLVRETISLPAGSYAVFFVTDDSHSYRDWNAAPPRDPAFWGITLRVSDPSLARYARTFEYQGREEKNVIVDLTRMRDSESQSRGFTLKRGMDLRICATGEGRDGRMFDYGWILDANTRRRIWAMEYDETEHAGGDRKNRVVEKVIRFERGSYIVHFVTDGSHSYRNWNAAPPYDPEQWGITVSSVDESFSPNDIAAYTGRSDAVVLARITGVRDNERRRELFTLPRASDLHIYAIGEGRSGRMSDYAWIENTRTGKVMWEMTFRKTEHAGGARRNRLFDGTVTLPAGEYAVFYETDGSHSFGDWNEAPPHDSESWGVTIMLAEREQR